MDCDFLSQKIHVILLNFIYMLRYVIQNLTGNFGIRFLVLSVGQACNYKCKDCANFCPVSPKEYKRYELDDILESIKRILKNVNFIQIFQIQGGEPFLYSELGGCWNIWVTGKIKYIKLLLQQMGVLCLMIN